MDAPKGPAAPASGTSACPVGLDGQATENPVPTFAELAADPEIAPLLDFDPVPVKPRANGWDAEAQRAFVALLAITGSKLRAARAIGRVPASMDRILKRDDAAGLRDAQDRALALYRRNHSEKLAHGFAAARKADPQIQAPGEVLNEFGEWEDEESYHRRAEEARDSISSKLLNARRLYLQEIADDPGKRAAFEILTELPIDWERARRLEPQADEPYNRANQRQPDMILTAESGWSFGECGYGPDKKAEARAAIDAYRAAEGLPPVEWEAKEHRA